VFAREVFKIIWVIFLDSLLNGFGNVVFENFPP